MSVIPVAATPKGGSTEWRTPPDLFAALNRRYQFDYDAFASHDNALCLRYSTSEGTFMGGIPIGGDPARDGLSYPWAGLRTFLNPPYARGLIEACVRKAYEERQNAEIIVALLPACPETQWFQRYVLPVCHLEWLPRRVKYIDPSGAKRVRPPFASVVAIYRADT